MHCVYLILVHKNFDQVSRLMRRLLMTDSGVIIHVDKKVGIPFNFLTEFENSQCSRVFLTEKRYFIEWGSFETVLACLALLEEGVLHFPAASYFVFLSCQDYPIKSAEFIDDFFRRNGSNFICHTPLLEEKWKYGGVRRINRFYWAKNRKSLPGYFCRTIPCPPRHFPIPAGKIHVGSLWCALKRDAVIKVLDFVKKHPAILKVFRWTYIPEEMFFQTVLVGFLNESKLVNKGIHFLEHFSLPRDWLRLKILNRNGYRNLGTADFEKLKSSSALFARKFDTTIDSGILDLLDTLP
jgi:Core-2/I-Branching enzyme